MKELLAAVFSGVAIASVAAIPGYASAMPDGFPDPAQFTETAVAPIKSISRAGSLYARFETPDGLRCYVSTNLVDCWGSPPDALPAFPADATDMRGSIPPCVEQQHVGYGSVSAGHFWLESRQCGFVASPVPVLPVGQKVTIGPTVCMIGENRLTACTDGESGFVIEPSGSWGF